MKKLKKILILIVCLALSTALMAGLLPAAHADYVDVEQAQYSVVRVFCSYGLGTGFAVGKEGEPVSYIVTNNHVIEDRTSDSDVYVTVTDINGGMNAEIVYTNAEIDYAILRLETPLTERRPIALRSPDNIHKAQDVYCIGFPGVSDAHNEDRNFPSRIEDLTITKGSVSNPKYNLAGTQSILSDAQANPGNSGGPMVDEKGCAIGITTSLITAENARSWMTVAVSMDYIMERLDALGIDYINADGDNAAEGESGEGDAEPGTEAPETEETESEESAPKAKLRINSKIIIIAACVLVVAIAAAVIIILVIKGKKASEKNNYAAAGPINFGGAGPANFGGPGASEFGGAGPAVFGGPGAGEFGGAAVPAGRLMAECVRGPIPGQRVSGNVIRIGRSAECDLAFPPDTHGVSRRHCEVGLCDKGIIVRDLGSSYGTILPNKQKLTAGGSALIRSGDVICLGSEKTAVRISVCN